MSNLGHFGFYNLYDWWVITFTQEEKDRFKELYKPMGGTFEDLFIGGGGFYEKSVVWFLTGLGGFATNKSDKKLSLKFLYKAEMYVEQSNYIDRHFLYSELITSHYKLRDTLNHYEKAKEYCLKQISIAKFAMEEFIKEWGNNKLRHIGYQQYLIILEKEKKYEDALNLCIIGMNQGWNNDWIKRIERLKKKIFN